MMTSFTENFNEMEMNTRFSLNVRHLCAVEARPVHDSESSASLLKLRIVGRYK